MAFGGSQMGAAGTIPNPNDANLVNGELPAGTKNSISYGNPQDNKTTLETVAPPLVDLMLSVQSNELGPVGVTVDGVGNFVLTPGDPAVAVDTAPVGTNYVVHQNLGIGNQCLDVTVTPLSAIVSGPSGIGTSTPSVTVSLPVGGVTIDFNDQFSPPPA